MFDTKNSSSRANLFANNLHKILVTLCMRLIGQKSKASHGLSIFRISMMFTELSRLHMSALREWS